MGMVRNGGSVLVAVTSFVSAVSFGSESSDWSEMGGGVIYIRKGCGRDKTGLFFIVVLNCLWISRRSFTYPRYIILNPN